MTRPRVPIWACCRFCHSRFTIYKNSRGHNCSADVEFQKERNRSKARAWWKEHGKEMYWLRKEGATEKKEPHKALCGHQSVNHYRCSECLKSKNGDVLGYPLGAW